MGEILPSNIDKCLQKYDLVIGTAIYVTVEIYLWAILSLTAIYNEFRMIERFNSANDSAFSEFAVNSSYYVILFGQQRSEGRTGVITMQIVLNGIFSIGIVCYAVSSVILLIGISEKKLNYFIAHLYLDATFLYLSLVGVVIGTVIQNMATFRNCLIFALRFYPVSCIYSLYKRIGGRPLTWTSYKSWQTINDSPLRNNNPAIRLARCDNEFDDVASNEECMKPKVSFNENSHHSSMSESAIGGEPKQSILKKTASLKKKELYLPINHSYPSYP